MFKKHPIIFLWTMALVVGIFLAFLEPIVQDISYHHFADTRTMYKISNFWNVVSNLPFLWVGIYALNRLFKVKDLVYNKEMYIAYVLLFLGVSLVAFGSGYYHLNPNNETLIWDRLPMTISFMALFSIIISEFIDLKEGKKLLFPLIVLGVISVGYWAYTETLGQGDLRLYVFVQFFPMLMIPILLIFFKPTFTLRRGYWYLLISYVLAKIFEYYDKEIYAYLGFISGHSLKHIVAAFGLYILVKMLMHRKREKIKEN